LTNPAFVPGTRCEQSPAVAKPISDEIEVEDPWLALEK